MTAAQDINDLAKSGAIPADPARAARPVNEKAKEAADEERRLVTVRQMLSGAYNRATTPKLAEDVITTGHWEIDRDSGGFKKGFVWIFGAKSHWGKSSSLVMFADENIKRSKRVLIISAEDPEELYADRLMIRRARVNKYRYDEGRLRPDEIDRVTEVASRGEDIPVFLNAVGKTVEWAVKRVNQLVKAEGIDLVAWDYLHAFDKEKRVAGDDQKRHSLNYIARLMSDTTKTLEVAGLIYGQVTPDTKAVVPDMYEIRDSKDVVNAADCVAIGYIPAMTVERDIDGKKVVIAESGDRAIVMAKKKTGPGPSGRIYKCGSDNTHGCFDIVPNPDDRFDAEFDRGMSYPDEFDT